MRLNREPGFWLLVAWLLIATILIVVFTNIVTSEAHDCSKPMIGECPPNQDEFECPMEVEETQRENFQPQKEGRVDIPVKGVDFLKGKGLNRYWANYLSERVEILIAHEGYSVSQAEDTVKLMASHYKGKKAK